MGEGDLVELLWKSGQVVRSSQTQRPPSDKPSPPPPPPPVLRGSGSGGGREENAPLPRSLAPLRHQQQQPYHQNLFIHEDEMTSWLQHQSFSSGLLYSPDTYHPHGSVSLAPPPPPLPSAPYYPPAERPTGQVIAARSTENFINLSRVRGNISTGPWIPVARESTQVGSSVTPLFSATEGTDSRRTVTGGVSNTFAVPGLGRREKAVVAIETSSGVSREETEPIQIQPPTEAEIADVRKRKERDEIGGTEEASRKRSRAAEMHNSSERRRREKINEKMKALQELIPRCNKSDKASMLDDAIDYVKSLQMQIQFMSTGYGMMPNMQQHFMPPNMQQFMAHMAMGMMGMNQPPFTPFPSHAHLPGPGPSRRYSFPNTQASEPSRVVQLPSQQPEPISNQPQFPVYMNPYRQVQSQTTSQLSFGQASSSKEPEDQENQPTGS